MFRHVRIIILVAVVAAIAVGLMLPGPRKTEQKTTQVSQIPVMTLD